MARKLYLDTVVLIRGKSLATDFVMPETTISYTDNVSYQIDVSTASSIGNFQLQGSNDGVSYVTLLTNAGIVNAVNDTIMVNVVGTTPCKYLRLAYVMGTPGTGTCTISITTKTVGA